MPLSDDTRLTGLVSMRRAAIQVATRSYEQVRCRVAGIVEHRVLQPFASSEFPSARYRIAAVVVVCAPALRPHFPFAQALRPPAIHTFCPLPIPKDVPTGGTQQLPATRPANAADCPFRQLPSSKGPLVLCTVVSPLCCVIPLLARQSRARQAAHIVGKSCTAAGDTRPLPSMLLGRYLHLANQTVPFPPVHLGRQLETYLHGCAESLAVTGSKVAHPVTAGFAL